MRKNSAVRLNDIARASSNMARAAALSPESRSASAVASFASRSRDSISRALCAVVRAAVERRSMLSPLAPSSICACAARAYAFESRARISGSRSPPASIAWAYASIAVAYACGFPPATAASPSVTPAAIEAESLPMPSSRATRSHCVPIKARPPTTTIRRSQRNGDQPRPGKSGMSSSSS